MDDRNWDERYSSADLVWSVTPNRWVADFAAGLTPGRALDVAGGEGRNSLWLIEHGWDATIVDFSKVGLERARQLAEERFDASGVAKLHTVCADVAQHTPEPQSFDLVVVAYLQVPAKQRRPALLNSANAVAPGGALIVVAHDTTNLTNGYGGPPDPDVLYSASEIAEDIAAAGLEIDRAEAVIRPVDVAGEERSAIDALLTAHRP